MKSFLKKSALRRHLFQCSIFLGLITVAAGSSPAQQIPAEPFQLFDSAMATVGLQRSDIHFDEAEMKMWQGDRWSLDFWKLLHGHPFAVPRHAELLRESCRDNLAAPVKLLQSTGRLLGSPVRRGLIDNPITKYLNRPDSAPKHSFTESRNILIGKELAKTRTAVDLLMRIVEDHDFSLRDALRGVNSQGYRKKLTQYFTNPDADTNQTDQLVEKLADTLDTDRLMAATQDLVAAVQYVADSLLDGGFTDFVTQIKSHQGMVVIGTSGDDKYDFVEAPLLILDGGGNDTYSFSGRNSAFPLTIIIDPSGNDTYRSTDTTQNGIGGAVCGVSILFDLAGDDRYEGKNICQGSALFGASILYDRSGNDQYSAQSWAQGAAAFGLGMLIDSAGNDSLYAWNQSQGFGYTHGVGCLINGAGNDVYVAEDSLKIDRSSQTKDHNTTMSQGAGCGRRADYIDGHSWAGGIGLLVDLAGDDRYSCGVFGQGVGYWYGVGMLLDQAGNDDYRGAWYVQGSAAHFAVGVLEDASGNDQYTALLNMAQGAGHDFSLGWLIEESGNDRYQGPNLSLGAGNDNGIGICWERGGDDSYTSATDVSLGAIRGQATGIRARLMTLGLFLDESGNDQFSGPTPAKNGSHWFGRGKDVPSFSPLYGVGFDH